ncbi:MAG: winged helix-turn-helix domain-containing protein [Candidatus Bathyarchaeia archaeon]
MVLQRGLGEDQILRSQAARLKLLRALTRAATFSEVVEKTGMSTATVSKYLQLMEEAGEVRKKLVDGRVVYELTTLGRRELHASLTPLENEVVRKFYLSGAVLDLQRKRSLTGVLLGIESPVPKDLVKSFALLKPQEREYLNFLAELYVHSVKEFLDKVEGQLNFIERRAAWQVVESDAWNKIIRKNGLHFDYTNTWEKFYGELNEELRGKMTENSLNKEVVFRKLRAFSFPLKERIKLLEESVI